MAEFDPYAPPPLTALDDSGRQKWEAARGELATAKAELLAAERAHQQAKFDLSDPRSTKPPAEIAVELRQSRETATELGNLIIPALELRVARAQEGIKRAQGAQHTDRVMWAVELLSYALTAHDEAISAVDRAKRLHARGLQFLGAAKAAGYELPHEAYALQFAPGGGSGMALGYQGE